MRIPAPAGSRQPKDRRPRRRRALAIGCLSLLAVSTATACSSTTQNGDGTAPTAAPSITRTGAAPTGPIRVTFEVDTYPGPGLPIPAAPDSAQGKALLKFVTQFNTTLPPGGRPIEARLVSSADLDESWASDNPSCAKAVPPADPAPDVFVPYQQNLSLGSLGCFAKAGTILLIGQSTLVPDQWLATTPGAFLLRGTTYSGWASAVSAVLDSGASPPPKRIVVMGPKVSFAMPQSLADSTYQDVVKALQRPGRTVTLFNSPTIGDDVASSEAAFAVVPTKLRRLGVDALVLPGIVSDPLPAEAMAKQKFTPPAIAGPGAVFPAQGYPMEQLRSLPAPTQDLDPQPVAVRLRSRLASTAEGKRCAQVMEPADRKLPPSSSSCSRWSATSSPC